MSTRSITARETLAVAAAAAAAASALTAGLAGQQQSGAAGKEGDRMAIDDEVVGTDAVQAALQSSVVRDEVERRVAELTAAALARLGGLAQPGQAAPVPASSPLPSPVASPVASPQPSPVGSPRVQLREPRLNELPSYDGAQGQKLDEWLDTLGRLADYYDLDASRAVKYAAVHFAGAAHLWWKALSDEAHAAIVDAASLAAALRSRFQPVTAATTARAELHRLEQGTRGVDAYISDFQRLMALVPTMDEASKMFQFERGLRRDLAEKLRIQGVTTLEAAIALVARVGNLMDTSCSSSVNRAYGASTTHPARVHQMEDGGAQSDADARIARMETLLYAMADGNGFSAKKQTYLDYEVQGGAAGSMRGGRGGHGGRGGRGGRGGSSSDRAPRPPMDVPGVAPEVVRQRLDGKLCVRCGADGHMSYACTNSIKSSN